jgi:N-acetyl-gamma-glutamyl-phosphate reductase
VKVNFVPCSGPFSRGIYSTCFAKLTQPFSKNEVISLYNDFYSKSIFIRIKNDPPRIKDIVSSNYCDLSFSVNGYDLVITAAIDNLIKGAAGGSIQLMNKLWGLDDCRGLQSSSVPWT